MLAVEVVNRSGVEVAERAAADVARRVLAAEGVPNGEAGITFVTPEEIRALKREHLGVDEVTDVLSFPIDGRAAGVEGVPRHVGDVVLCPEVVGDAWEGPLVHGVLHLLGYEHGEEMREREERYGGGLA